MFDILSTMHVHLRFAYRPSRYLDFENSTLSNRFSNSKVKQVVFITYFGALG